MERDPHVAKVFLLSAFISVTWEGRGSWQALVITPDSSGVQQQSSQVSLKSAPQLREGLCLPLSSSPLESMHWRKRSLRTGPASQLTILSWLTSSPFPLESGPLSSFMQWTKSVRQGRCFLYQASLCPTIVSSPPSLLTGPLLGQPNFPVQLSYIPFQMIKNTFSINKLPLLLNQAFPALSEDRSVRKSSWACKN